jgi:hypothetical protein
MPNRLMSFGYGTGSQIALNWGVSPPAFFPRLWLCNQVHACQQAHKIKGIIFMSAPRGADCNVILVATEALPHSLAGSASMIPTGPISFPYCSGSVGGGSPNRVPYTLEYLAGHSDFATTRRYVHPQAHTVVDAHRARAKCAGWAQNWGTMQKRRLKALSLQPPQFNDAERINGRGERIRTSGLLVPNQEDKENQ